MQVLMETIINKNLSEKLSLFIKLKFRPSHRSL